MTCNGAPLRITKSLHDALCNVRKPSEIVTIWADAVCINQDDVAEKSSQVLRMREIYANADKLFIWLGQQEYPGDEHVALAVITKLHRIFLRHTDEKSLLVDSTEASPILAPSSWPQLIESALESDPLTSEEWDGLARFYLQPWFTRVWIYQEVTSPVKDSATHISIAYGKVRISWDTLAAVTTGLSHVPRLIKTLLGDKGPERHKFPSAIIRMIQTERNTHHVQLKIPVDGPVDEKEIVTRLDRDKMRRGASGINFAADASTQRAIVMMAITDSWKKETPISVSDCENAYRSLAQDGLFEDVVRDQLMDPAKKALEKLGISRLSSSVFWNKLPLGNSGGQLGRLWQHLQMSRLLFSTDPRDKLYAFLGHLGEGLNDDSLLKPSYSKTIADVFTDITLFFIQRDMCLSIFQLHYNETRSGPEIPGLPTWVNDWTQITGLQPFTWTDFCTGTSDKSGYSRHALLAQVSSDRGRISLPVFIVGRIIVSADDYRPPQEHTAEDPGSDYENRMNAHYNNSLACTRFLQDPDAMVAAKSYTSVFSKRGSFTDSSPPSSSVPYVTGGSLYDAFWRTLIFNGGRAEERAGEGRGPIPQERAFRLFHHHYFPGSKSDDEFFHDLGIETDEGKMEMNNMERDFGTWYGHSIGRRFCVTENGLIGWIPNRARTGVICVIPGATTPYVINKSSKGWEMIGSAYIHGLMDQLVYDEVLKLTKKGRKILGESAQPMRITLV